jgi:hypothetical protein
LLTSPSTSQTLTAFIVFFFTLLNACTCLCACLCGCCKSERFGLIISIFKTLLALAGVIALGVQMKMLQDALKVMGTKIAAIAAAFLVTSPSAGAAAIVAYVISQIALIPGIAGADETALSLVVYAASAGDPVKSGRTGNGGMALAILGLLLLSVNTLLHMLLVCRCGGAAHHPEDAHPHAEKLPTVRRARCRTLRANCPLTFSPPPPLPHGTAGAHGGPAHVGGVSGRRTLACVVRRAPCGQMPPALRT